MALAEQHVATIPMGPRRGRCSRMDIQWGLWGPSIPGMHRQSRFSARPTPELSQAPVAPRARGGRQAWVGDGEGGGRPDGLQSLCLRQLGSRARTRLSVTPHGRGAAATSRVSPPPHPSRSATCFYQFEAEPQGLPQVGSALLLSDQPPLRHLEMISHYFHSPGALKTPPGWAGLGVLGGGLQPQSNSQRTPRLPQEAAPHTASPPTHSTELC